MASAESAERYHSRQIATFADTEADFVTAMTMTYAAEAIGITRAAMAAHLPVVISFTVETDGRLPTGQSLEDAINQVDDATSGGPAYYMVNCAHPLHFSAVLDPGADWTSRIKGVRLNASRLSHAELNDASELDEGDIPELGRLVGTLHKTFPHINVLGGCCGTDLRHIREIAKNIQENH
jgi:S-methylmethionine-dependent homocysteine/selenocysteine methylase